MILALGELSLQSSSQSGEIYVLFVEGCSIAFTSAKKITLDCIVSVQQLHDPLCCFNKDITESIITLSASFFVRSRGKKHSVILRTQLTVRVHACIGELLCDMIMVMHVFNMRFALDTHTRTVRHTSKPNNTWYCWFTCGRC